MMKDGHLGDLKLRRLFAGELAGPEGETERAHAAACAECGQRLRAIGDEQRHFEEQIPFERFAAGVERASRSPRAAAPAPRARWLYPVMGIAAACVLTVAGRQLVEANEHNRTKGGGDIDVVVAGPANGPQRKAAVKAPEALAPGERVRIGYEAGDHRFLTSVSIDDQGQVTPLYPEAGSSLPAASGRETHYLPGSLVFTGKGTERLVVILSDEPLDVDRVKTAAKAAYDTARGDLSKIDRLEVPGEQFHRTFLKP